MPDCPASSQSGTGMKKLTMLELVLCRTKPMQSGICLVRYRTEFTDAGMPMPALVFWIPIPSYAYIYIYVHTVHTYPQYVHAYKSPPKTKKSTNSRFFYFRTRHFRFICAFFLRAPALFLPSRSRSRKREKGVGAQLCNFVDVKSIFGHWTVLT